MFYEEDRSSTVGGRIYTKENVALLKGAILNEAVESRLRRVG